jgi:hypothetical protein
VTVTHPLAGLQDPGLVVGTPDRRTKEDYEREVDA